MVRVLSAVAAQHLTVAGPLCAQGHKCSVEALGVGAQCVPRSQSQHLGHRCADTQGSWYAEGEGVCEYAHVRTHSGPSGVCTRIPVGLHTGRGRWQGYPRLRGYARGVFVFLHLQRAVRAQEPGWAVRGLGSQPGALDLGSPVLGALQ